MIDVVNQLAEVLAIPHPETRIASLTQCLDDTRGYEEAKSLVRFLFSNSARERYAPARPVMDMIALFGKACAWILRYMGRVEAMAFLHGILKDDNLAPGARLVITSYLSVAAVIAKIKIVTVISIYDGQISLMGVGEHPLAENALHRKIEQFEDLYGFNKFIDWGVIFIDDGDDRKIGDIYRRERTSRIIYRELSARYAQALTEGKLEVIELDNEVREGLRSMQGGAIIYGMQKALQRGAEIVFYTNIDLDSHLGLQGLLLAALQDGTTQIAVGSNRASGSFLYAPLPYYLYSVVLNWFVRWSLPVGNLRDTHNAFKGFRREALQKIIPMSEEGGFDRDMDYFFSFPDMLLARASILGLGIKEVPVAMHRTAPLQFFPSLRSGLFYYQSVWNQRRYLRAWEQHGRKALRLLAVQERRRANGPATVEIKDKEMFDLEQTSQYLHHETNSDNVIRRLQALFNACTSSPLTVKQLDVLRSALSVSLKREDRQQIAEFLEHKAAAEELNSTVQPFVESFLTVYQDSKATFVATVLALGRAEDALRPEYLEMKVAQLTDLYSVNPLIRWCLIVIEESREGVSFVGWQAMAHELYSDLMSQGKIQFLYAPPETERPPNWFKGGSILLGMAHAARLGIDFVIFTDAKPAIDLGQEGWLLKYAIERGHHVVIGSRYLPGSRLVRGVKRRFASRLYNLAIRALLPHLGPILFT